MLDSLLDSIARVAPELIRKDVWLVGGAVRDAKMDIAPKDYDLVVEGDAVALAEYFATVVEEAEVVASYPNFGVATVEYLGLRWDFASARTETYPKVGKLPQVKFGASIYADLQRRDFTVNAMAVNLLTRELVAVDRASEDLANRQLRVLHYNSFREDPTRMLRLLRYCGQGFTVHPQTRRLIHMDLLMEVGPGRLLKEFP